MIYCCTSFTASIEEDIFTGKNWLIRNLVSFKVDDKEQIIFMTQ